MMQIRLKQEWDGHKAGDVVDPLPRVASALVHKGLAEYCIECAALEQPETAVGPRPRKRRKRT